MWPYAHLLEDHKRYPVLVDAKGHVLSMPPIINSDSTKVKGGSKRLFIDVTGISEAAVDNSLHTLVCSLIELGAKISTVRVRQNGQERVTPDLSPKQSEIELARGQAMARSSPRRGGPDG